MREERAAPGRGVGNGRGVRGGECGRAELAGGHQRCAGERVFSGGMPDLRRVADEREPRANLRSVPGVVCSRAATCLRCLWAASAGVYERAGLCAERGAGAALLGLPGQDICVRTGAKLCGVRRRAGAGDPSAEIRADRPTGGVVCGAAGGGCEGASQRAGRGRGGPGTRCTASGNASAGTTKRRCSPSRWRRNSNCHIKLCC